MRGASETNPETVLREEEESDEAGDLIPPSEDNQADALPEKDSSEKVEDSLSPRLHARLESDRAASKKVVALPSEDFRPVPVEYSTALVLLAHDRFDYIQRTLEHVLKAHNAEKYTIMVSVDRDRLIEQVKAAVNTVPNPKKIPISFLASEQPFADVRYQDEPSITRHMASVFHQVFKLRLFEYVIFLEDDLEVSYDFFDYFATVGPLLHPLHPTASNLFCVSAWNDNGFNHADLEASRVFRTDWYPGLGVMFHRSMWVGRMEFEWPLWDSVEWGYDNWLRYRSTITKSHDCLAPDVSRTFHYATRGMHVGAVAAPMYERMTLSDGKTNISEPHIVTAMTALHTRDYYKKLIQESTLVNINDLLSRHLQGNSVLAYFDDKNNARDPREARLVLTKFNLYPDNFRMRFRGLLTFKVKSTGVRVTLIAESMRDYWSQGL